MKKKQKLCAVLLCILVLFLLPCWVFAVTPDEQGSAANSLVTSTTATAQPLVEDKGNFLERSIAGLVNNIADALNSLISFLTGFDNLNDLLFNLAPNWSDEMNPAPLDETTWSMLDKMYGGIATVAYGLFMLLPLVSSFRFLGGAFTKSPRARAEAMQTLWRMVIAAVAIMAVPVLFRMFLVAANAIQGLVATAVANSYSGGLNIDGDFLNNIRTGSVLLTSIVRMGFVFIGLQIGVLYAVRKIVLSTMYVFTPLMLVLWVIKKDITAASVWVGEMLTNSFMLTAYTISAGVVSFIIGGNQSWVIKLLAVFMIVPLGNTLRNGLQNLFTRWAGVDEERIAGGFTGTMASAFGVQSITRMVGAMSMTFGGATGGPVGGVGGAGSISAESIAGAPNNAESSGQAGVWGMREVTTPPSPPSKQIGFAIPPRPSEAQSQESKAPSDFVPADLRDLLEPKNVGNPVSDLPKKSITPEYGGMQASPVVAPDLPDPYGKVEAAPLTLGRADVHESPTSNKQKQQHSSRGSQKYDPEDIKTFLRIQKADKVARIAGGVVGGSVRAASFVGFGSPITRPLAEGVSRGVEWISEKLLYGAGVGLESFRTAQRIRKSGGTTTMFHEFQRLHNEYQKWSKHPFVPPEVQAQLLEEQFLNQAPEMRLEKQMEEQGREAKESQLSKIYVKGKEILVPPKIPKVDARMAEKEKQKQKQHIGFEIPLEAQLRAVMLNYMTPKRERAFEIATKAYEQFKQHSSKISETPKEEQRTMRPLEGLQVDDPDKLYPWM